MKSTNKLNMFYIMLCLFIIIFDQAMKFSALAFIPTGTVINVCPSINLLLTFNFGTSFGLLSPSNAMQYYLIIILTICCIIFISFVFSKLKTVFEKVLCIILIGGAVGNLLDRFLHGAVIDFIDVYYKNFHWPAFNFADACITCGVIGLILYNLFSKKVS